MPVNTFHKLWASNCQPHCSLSDLSLTMLSFSLQTIPELHHAAGNCPVAIQFICVLT